MMPSIFDYLSPKEVEGLAKLASASVVKNTVGTVGKGLLGFGLGTVGGFALGSLANAVYKKTTGSELPEHLLVPAASLLGAGMGMAYSLYKAKELEELQRVFKAHRDKSEGRVPGK